MATRPETAEFLLDTLGREQFSVRRMFGEYAVYAHGKTVGFVCDDLFYVKIMRESAALETVCEKDEAYPGSKLYYVVTEDQLVANEDLPTILIDVARALPAKPSTKRVSMKRRR